MIDRRPRVIVPSAGVDDVVAAVNFAREAGLAIAVRGGVSPSVPGFGTADRRGRDRTRPPGLFLAVVVAVGAPIAALVVESIRCAVGEPLPSRLSP